MERTNSICCGAWIDFILVEIIPKKKVARLAKLIRRANNVFLSNISFSKQKTLFSRLLNSAEIVIGGLNANIGVYENGQGAKDD